MEPYAVGSWVMNKENGRLGFIETQNNDIYYVRWILSKDGTRFRVSSFHTFEEVELAPLYLHQEDFKVLQHLAVKTDDKVWFMEIAERMRR